MRLGQELHPPVLVRFKKTLGIILKGTQIIFILSHFLTLMLFALFQPTCVGT